MHDGAGFTGSEVPNYMLSADSGEMQIRFSTDASKNGKGFSAVFSADCPPLQPGQGNLLKILFETDKYIFPFLTYL